MLHRWLVKDQLEQVTCGEAGCGKVFSNKGNLTVHKKAVHMKILPFKCTDCGKGFFRPALLEQHRYACGSLLTSACIKVLNLGLGPFKDQTAEMILFFTQKSFFSILRL